MVLLAVASRKDEEGWNSAKEIKSEPTRKRSAKNEGINDSGIN